MALQVQGRANDERVATACGVNVETADARLRALAAADLAKERTGRHAGFTITPSGTQRLEKLLAEEGLRTSDELHETYERFTLVNARVLKVCSDWQLRTDGGVEVANDHSDAAYDESVIDRLVDLHARASTCVAAFAQAAPRYATYGSRLDTCVARLRSDDLEAFTAVMAESYHTVWFELHQDLLLTLGLQRPPE